MTTTTRTHTYATCPLPFGCPDCNPRAYPGQQWHECEVCEEVLIMSERPLGWICDACWRDRPEDLRS